MKSRKALKLIIKLIEPYVVCKKGQCHDCDLLRGIVKVARKAK